MDERPFLVPHNHVRQSVAVDVTGFDFNTDTRFVVNQVRDEIDIPLRCGLFFVDRFEPVHHRRIVPVEVIAFAGAV